MLVLTRKEGERIRIGDGITLTVVSIRGNKVRLGFTAPESVIIQREELREEPKERPNKKTPANQVEFEIDCPMPMELAGLSDAEMRLTF